MVFSFNIEQATDNTLRPIYYGEEGCDSNAVTLKQSKRHSTTYHQQYVDEWRVQQASQQLERTPFLQQLCDGSHASADPCRHCWFQASIQYY